MILTMHSIEPFMITYMFFSFLKGILKIQQEILGVELENTGSQKERIKEALRRKSVKFTWLLVLKIHGNWIFTANISKKRNHFFLEDVFFFF